MRKILLFPALFLIFSVASATEGSQDNVTSTPQIGGLFPHFNSAIGSGAATPTDLRLIAKTYSVYKDLAFMPSDSTTYTYGNHRGSVPNPDDLNNDDHVLFNESVNYLFNPSVMGYENNEKRTQLFSGNKVDKLIYQDWHQQDATWKNREMYTYVYDSKGKMETSVLQLWFGGSWTQDMVSNLKYDNNNNVIAMQSLNYIVDFAYDANNNLVRIVDKIWDVSKGLINNERKSYAYSGKDVTVFELEKWVNNGWALSQKWEYGYDVDKNVVLTTEYAWNGNGWTSVKQNKYSYDKDGNLEVDIEKVWNSGGFENRKMKSITYNSKSLPETVLTQTWVNNGWKHVSGDISIHFYYEQYDPTSVNMFAENAEINVYPVPASDVLNVSLSIGDAQDINLSLIDMSGRVVYFKQAGAKLNYKQAIPVNNLPAGNYILAVQGTYAGITRKVMVSH